MGDKEKRAESRSFWSFPRMRHPFSLLENIEDDWDLNEFSSPSGLSVFEDDGHVYIEAALPGIRPHEVDMVYDKGFLWIKAEKKHETEAKKKKFYRKATSSFSYRIAVPGEVDEGKQPKAICRNGILHVTFSKKNEGLLKKIPVTEE